MIYTRLVGPAIELLDVQQTYSQSVLPTCKHKWQIQM